MLFWHCTMRTSKKQDRLCIIKVKFHVFTGYKNEQPIEQFFSSSHLRNDQLNFNPYSVKIAKTCWRGLGKSLCLKSFHRS